MAYTDLARRKAYIARYRAEHAEEIKAKAARYAAEHREEIKAYQSRYDIEHADKVKARKVRYRAEHADEIRTTRTLYNLKNAERIRNRQLRYAKEHPEKRQAWRKKNAEQIKARQARYRAEHPEIASACAARRRAHKSGAPVNDFTQAQWLELQAACDHRCAYCGRRAKGHLTQDHILALSNGGSHTLSNIVPACRSCNCKKHVGPPLAQVQPLLLTISTSKRKI